jgi:hypothetical protein
MTRYEVNLDPDEAEDFSLLFPSDKIVYNAASSAGQKLADAIRGHCSKPQRMTEPGWGEKVIAHLHGGSPETWLRDAAVPGMPWSNIVGTRVRWDQLIDPEPVP